jgi:uncharacterized delta-60 repeat protein
MKTLLIFLLTIVLVYSEEILPQYGQLDPTFGQGGKVMTAINVFGPAYISGTAIQSDGKIIAAGSSHNSANYDFTLARYNIDGTLDYTFGTNGNVTTLVGAFEDHASSIVIQTDGKIITAGSSSNGTDYDFTLVRYNSDGTLDNTFGTNGIVTTQIGNYGDLAFSSAIQSDGKIVAAGYSVISNGDFLFALARYNTNGTLDNTFGINGKVTTPVGDGIAYSIVIQSDGKIVAAGYREGTDFDIVLTRYNTNGTLDNSFGTNGIVTTDIGTSHNEANSVAIQSDGKIVAAGYSFNGINTDFTLVRYNTNGTLDNTFGSNGIVITQIGSASEIARAVAVQSDGKIVASGYIYIGSDIDFALARFNSNGTLDNSFASNGTVVTQVSTSEDYINSMALQPDGKIVVAGYSGDGSSSFTLARYAINGTLDNTFGSNGTVTTRAGTADAEIYSIAFQNDGKIVAAGFSRNNSNYDFAIARYNTNGSLDNTFGTNGIITTPALLQDDYLYSVAVQNDGKIVAAGSTENTSNVDFVLARYNTNGTLDNTFGGDGIIVTQIGSSDDFASSLVIQSDEKIVVGGTARIGSTDDFAVARYNTSGALDVTFGTNGIVTTPIGSSNDGLRSVILQSDGKIIAAGFSWNGSNYDFALVRYTTAGVPDISFGINGIVTTQMGSFGDYINSVMVQSDGKIVAAGYTFNGNENEFALARYQSNGFLDDTFGTNGKVMTSFGNLNAYIYSAAIQSDGKIVVGGFSGEGSDADFTLARYYTNGTLDNTFGTNGIITTPVGIFSNNKALSLEIQSDGNIVAAGFAGNEFGSYNVFALARYLGLITGIEEENTGGIPNSYLLEQNYPNPFNPSTVISYRLPVTSNVTLKVYDILGNEIATLVNEEKPAGEYEVEFNTSSIKHLPSSGIYFYQLKAGSFIQTKKMILLK